MTETRNRWNSINIRIKCPEGTAFIHILENSPGDIYRIFITIGKAGSSVNSQAYAIAELVSELFACGKGINEVISKLSGITSDRPPARNEGGTDVRSIPEAITIALMKYRTTIPRIKYERQPVRFARR